MGRVAHIQRSAAMAVACLLVACAASSCTVYVPSDQSDSQSDERVYDRVLSDETTDVDEAEGENSQESEDADPGSLTSGGEYSHHWYLDGDVADMNGNAFTLQTDEGDYRIDARTAKANGRYPQDMVNGDRVRVAYFLYDLDGSNIKADSIERLR